VIYVTKANKRMTNLDSGFKKAWYFVCLVGCTNTGVAIHKSACDRNFKVTVLHRKGVQAAIVSLFVEFVI
jgi:hypothetical protein